MAGLSSWRSLYGSLYFKLAGMLVLIILTMGFVYGFITYSVTYDYLQESTQQFNRELARKLVGERKIVVNGKINRQALKQTFHDYMTVNPNIEIYLLDLKGKILSYSADPGKVKRASVALGPIESFFRGELVPGDDSRSFTMQKAFSVTYVPTEAAAEAYLYIVLRGEEYDQVNQALQNNYVIQYSLLSLIISLAIGLLLGLLLFYTITRRVRNLSLAMHEFTENGFSATPDKALLDKNHNDEIAYLARSFDVMAEHTIAQLNKLEEQDRLRRELVANISHDLRTPLASMLGYLETLTIKGQRLNEASRAQYLNIVSQHGKRLSHLIDDLFELAKFDAQEITPHREVFSFSELPKVFERFYQADNKHRKGQHAGLGLAIVKRILALHERQIKVSSTVGAGTQFCFSFPLGYHES